MAPFKLHRKPQLPSPYCHIAAFYSKLNRKAKARADIAQRKIDGILQETLQNQRPSWPVAFAYAKQVLIGCIYKPAIHAAAVAILLIAIGSGIFIPLDQADLFTRVSLISVAMLVGSGIALVTLVLLLPLHLRYRLNLWANVALHALVSTTIFCLIEPEIIRNFQSYKVPGFADIFVPVLLLHGLADLFVLWQIKGNICVLEYSRKHERDHIETVLPTEKRGEVWLISAADHYVEITTQNGTHMHRMTMKAAVEKAGPDEGLRVHRSHWVAYAAMLSLEKDGERNMLTLRSGERVPVSQKNVAKVRCFLDEDCQDDTP